MNLPNFTKLLVYPQLDLSQELKDNEIEKGWLPMLETRFIEYVKIDTQSDPDSKTSPSTAKQLVLAKLLVEQLLELGLGDAHVDEFGIVYASLDGNDDTKDPIGFIAHMDTSPDASGANVQPRIIRNYDGSKIILNEEKDITLDPETFELLEKVVGDDIVVTDGNTLLGGDDKAGIAIIMEMIEFLVNHPEVPHNDVKIAFTPDEEIGRGPDNFDIEKFGAKYAYTIDGGLINELSYENFNAFSCEVVITGKSVHPGAAKNKMVSANMIAFEFDSLLPSHKRPYYTSGYEGFNHLHKIEGTTEKAKMDYIIRNHDLDEINNQIARFNKIAAFLNDKYGYQAISLTFKESYLNMVPIIEKRYYIIQNVIDKMKELKIKPKIVPIRGGTDGARLTYMGLPCPNLGTGGGNAHGPFEFVSLTQMKQQVKLLVALVS